jgi:hypothetical protein
LSAASITLASLAPHPVWVGWKKETRGGKPTKLPYDPKTGRKAKADNSSTWATRNEADKWAAKTRADGVGLVLTTLGDNLISGVDLDACRDPQTGVIERWAKEVIDRLDTYTEVSPSGTGVKLFFTLFPGDLPAVETLFDGKYGRMFKRTNSSDHPPAIEIHRGHRYFAVTQEMISASDDFRLVTVADLRWLIIEHGPQFAGQQAKTDQTSKTNRASKQSDDKSRSAKAFRAGAILKASGASYEKMRDGLLQHEDPEIVDWANTKGMANDERELKRTYHKAWAQGSIIKVGGADMRLVDLDNLNERFAILDMIGKPSVYVSRRDRMTIQENDLKRRLANEVVLIGTKDEKPVYEGAFKFWNRHAHRHVYRRIAFTSKDLPADTLNLFRGFGVTPKEGCCDLILGHIYEVICSGDATSNNAMLNLMAWQMQNIGKPSRVIVVIRTEHHQAGKGLLLNETLLKVYGEAGFVPSSTDQVLGRFNDVIVGRAYIFLDEAMFFGDRRAADAIKSLATTTLHGIETKGLPTIQCPVGLNFWMATNHDVAAFIEEHDTRYWVINASEHRVGDTPYFTSLLKEIENGGREAFAYHLLNRDVSKFVPLRDAPKNNDAKREMIKLAINPYDARKWLEECCETGQIIGHSLLDNYGRKTGVWHAWVEGLEFAFSTLSNAYTNWQASVKSPVRPEPTPIASLGEALTRAGFGEKRTSTERRRVLPNPDDCLAKLYVTPSNGQKKPLNPRQ